MAGPSSGGGSVPVSHTGSFVGSPLLFRTFTQFLYRISWSMFRRLWCPEDRPGPQNRQPKRSPNRSGLVSAVVSCWTGDKDLLAEDEVLLAGGRGLAGRGRGPAGRGTRSCWPGDKVLLDGDQVLLDGDEVLPPSSLGRYSPPCWTQCRRSQTKSRTLV